MDAVSKAKVIRINVLGVNSKRMVFPKRNCSWRLLKDFFSVIWDGYYHMFSFESPNGSMGITKFDSLTV